MLRRFAMLLLGLPPVVPPLVVAQPWDLLLVGARVVDGSGNPWFQADVGIRAGRIAAIGALRGQAAARTIELDGLYLAPGFVDMMGGTSVPLLLDPASGDSKLLQGITTMMAGEGSSEAPQNDRTWPPAGAGRLPRWSTFREYFALLDRKELRLNVVHNVGAAQVRRFVLGDEDRDPTGPELERMKQLVEEAMRDGAVGLSSALIYPPGTFARTEELAALAGAAGRFGGFYSTHMRNESSRLLQAIEEALEIGRRGGVPVHIYHLKAAGEENWPLMPKALERIRRARAAGMDVTADIYPYIRNGLGLGSFIHPRHYAAGSAALRARLRDPDFRDRLRQEMETTADWENWYRHVGRNWDHVLVAQASQKRFEGKSVAAIAALRGADVWTTFFDLVAEGDLSVNPKSMNEDQKHMALREEFISLCTDAAPANPAITTGAHPRAFGSFPRVLGFYVREQGILSLESAIRRMTSLAANRLGLFGRGRIAIGMAADLVAFDFARVRDRATFEQPVLSPEGIEYVIVNGRVAVEKGRSTGEAAGRALRRGQW